MRVPATFFLCLASAVYAAATALVERATGTAYTGGITASDVRDGVCAPLTLIFARGSTEKGNMGDSVGPALAMKLIEELGVSQVAVQGVEYEASWLSNLFFGSKGGPVMASLAKQALKQCSSTKIALAGYSQGGEVVHFAVSVAGLNSSSVSSVVLYGDPEHGLPVVGLPTSKVKEFCATDDGVCEQDMSVFNGAHGSYTKNGDIESGARFIKQRASL